MNPTCDTSEEYSFDLNMVNLSALLRKMWEKAPDSRYFNVDILSYQLKSKGNIYCPLFVSSQWSCEPSSTSVIIDYKYNPSCLSTPNESLKNVAFNVSIDGDVKSINSTPEASWNPENNVATWKLDSISPDSNTGCLRANCVVALGPSVPSPVSVQFNCQGVTFSGLEFLLNCSGYRISLIKKHVSSGKILTTTMNFLINLVKTSFLSFRSIHKRTVKRQISHFSDAKEYDC